jgi:hypothetical protein
MKTSGFLLLPRSRQSLQYQAYNLLMFGAHAPCRGWRIAPANKVLSPCHETIASPENGPPAVQRHWYRLLARGDTNTIRQEWLELTEQVNGPEQYAMAILPYDGDFSIAIVVDGGILTVRANVGVVWVPLQSLRPLNYRRLKHV